MIDILMPLLADIAKVGDQAYEKYRTDVQIHKKDDKSPVTNVDRLIHAELSQSLAHFFADIPVVSEEGDIPSVAERQAMDAYWLLDPLDGTQAFIDETDQFVISLGYITKQQPTMGILHHPVSGKTWIGIQNRGVFVQHHGGEICPIQPPVPRDDYIILVSAHYNDQDLANVVARQRSKEQSKPVVLKPVSSALKFGYLAEGLADEYLRFTQMMEWDFAAGHCIALESGFNVLPLDPNESVVYGSASMKVPPMSVRKNNPI